MCGGVTVYVLYGVEYCSVCRQTFYSWLNIKPQIGSYPPTFTSDDGISVMLATPPCTHMFTPCPKGWSEIIGSDQMLTF